MAPRKRPRKPRGQPRPTAPTPSAIVVRVALAGTMGGVVLWVVTDLLSRSTVGGADWSLGGNGALAIVFAGGPCLLAFEWTLLALWRRSGRPRLLGGAVAALVALVLSSLEIFGPVAGLGSELLLLVPLIAAATGIGLTIRFGGAKGPAVVAAAASCLLLLAVAVLLSPLYYLLAPVTVAPLMVVPLLAEALTTEEKLPGSQAATLLGAVLLPVALISGLWAAGAASFLLASLR